MCGGIFSGEFGNASPTWPTYRDWLHDWQDDGWENRLYHLRNRIAGGPTYYNLTGEYVPDSYHKLVKKGVDPSSLYVSEMAPTELTVFQGEVRRSINHLDLYYSTIAKPMRDSLREGGKQAYGLKAGILLRYYLDGPSYDWLQHLLGEYDNHVIEFSTYSVKWGTVPGMNTVFWEVRNY